MATLRLELTPKQKVGKLLSEGWIAIKPELFKSTRKSRSI